jgi:hypothetical protein
MDGFDSFVGFSLATSRHVDIIDHRLCYSRKIEWDIVAPFERSEIPLPVGCPKSIAIPVLRR